MGTTDHAATIQRILDILQADPTLKPKVREWRYGELPEQTQAHRWPAVYVTVATNPEVSRESKGVSRTAPNGLQVAPVQQITTEYWIVIVTSPAVTPTQALKDLLAIQKDVIRILTNDMQLQLSPSLRRMAQTSTISSQSRLTMAQGKMVQSMTIMLRAMTIDDHR